MKRLLAALFAPLFLLAACATPGTTTGPIPAVSQINVDKAMYAGEAAWKGALTMVDAAVSSGVLVGDNAARVRTVLAQAKTQRDRAWALYDVGNSTGALAAISQVQGLVGSIGAYVKPAR